MTFPDFDALKRPECADNGTDNALSCFRMLQETRTASKRSNLTLLNKKAGAENDSDSLYLRGTNCSVAGKVWWVEIGRQCTREFTREN